MALKSSAGAATMVASEPRLVALPFRSDEHRLGTAPSEEPPRFESQGHLAHGGMGTIQLVNDRLLGRTVALKELLDQLRYHSTYRRRLLREAVIQAGLEHPAIVPVYDISLDAYGNPKILMKRVSGATLASVLDLCRTTTAGHANGAPLGKLLSSFVSVCHAVHYAHTRGVIHRDLKPSNIMLGDFGEVYVMDWGIAKVGQGWLSSSLELTLDEALVVPFAEDATHSGDILGTPGYMAPEQALGVTDGHGPAADVYALGAILFEIVLGEPLHPGLGPEERLQSTLEGVPARIAERGPGRDLPEELERLWLRATALHPDDRTLSARGLAEGVEAFLHGARDLARNREKAKELALQAAFSEGSTVGCSPEGQREALQRGAQALALDPQQPLAAQVVQAILNRPLPSTPPEVETEILQRQDTLLRRVLRFGGAGQLLNLGVLSSASVFMALPMTAEGLANWRQLQLNMGLAGVTAFVQARQPRAEGLGLAAPMGFTALAVYFATQVDTCYSALSLFYAISASILAIVGAGERLRAVAAGFGFLLGLIVLHRPLLEWAELVPPTLAVTTDRHVLSFRSIFAFARPEDLHLMLIPGFLGMMVYSIGVAFVFVRARQQQQRLGVELQWQLRQLLPPGARDTCAGENCAGENCARAPSSSSADLLPGRSDRPKPAGAMVRKATS